MAGELFVGYVTGQAVDALIFNAASQIWRTTTLAFETYNSAHYANYVVPLAELGATGNYAGDFPTDITEIVNVNVAYRSRTVSGAPAETDYNTGTTDTFTWDGREVVTDATGRLPLDPANCAVSGRVVDLSGNPVSAAKITATPSNVPESNSAGSVFAQTLPPTYSDANGEWTLELQRGAAVKITIDKGGASKSFTVPDTSTALYKDLP